MLTPIAPPNHWPTRTTSSTSVTLGAGDAVLLCSNSSDAVVTTPNAASVPSMMYWVQKIGTNTALVEVKDHLGNVIVVLFVAGDSALIQSDGSNWHVIGGYLTPHFGAISRAAAQTGIAADTQTKILHDTIDANTGGLADIANSRLIIQRTGLYILLATGSLAAGGQIIPLLVSSIRVNGVTVSAQRMIQDAAAYDVLREVPDRLHLNAGDVVDSTLIYSGVAGPKSTNTGPDKCFLKVAEIR